MGKLILSIVFILGIILVLSFVSAECTDSDGGQSFYEKGETAVTYPGNTDSSPVPSGNTGYSFDHCFQNTLSESICTNGDSTFVEYKCPNECFDGFCLENNEKGYVLTEKNELTVSLGDKNYIISVHNISSSPSGSDASFRLKISGDLEEITGALGTGESHVLSNGLLIKVTDTDAIRMYGTPASVTFTISDSTSQNPQQQNNVITNVNNSTLLYWIIGIVVIVAIILLVLFLVKKKT